MDPETEFLQGLIELQYDQADIPKLKSVANNVAWAKGWPNDKVSFWNAEAFMWSRKITKETRAIIKQQLPKTNNNLDLGCGAYSYIPSVGFDLSEKMLNNNTNLTEKITGDLEQPLPFTASFSSITAIFILNYIQNYQQLLNEIHRILEDKGTFTMILSSNPVKQLHQQHQKNNLSSKEWLTTLKQHFTVKLSTTNNLHIYTCQKQKT